MFVFDQDVVSPLTTGDGSTRPKTTTLKQHVMLPQATVTQNSECWLHCDQRLTYYFMTYHFSNNKNLLVWYIGYLDCNEFIVFYVQRKDNRRLLLVYHTNFVFM